ncbi:hypothetical protein M128_3738 [Bacteroides fragilis str. S6L8]|nr:hypothetical protein M128_3738 [Bacteroides fragilis str. S6L8]
MELPLSDSFLWLIIKNASGRSDELFPFLPVCQRYRFVTSALCLLTWVEVVWIKD